MVPSCTAHPAGITSRVSCWKYLLWLQRCKDAKRQRAKGRKVQAKSAEPQGQCHKGAALSSPFLYTSPLRVNRERAVNAGWSACCNGQITVGRAVSPSWPGAKQAGETGWWLGHVTISGLGT